MTGRNVRSTHLLIGYRVHLAIHWIGLLIINRRHCFDDEFHRVIDESCH